MRKTCLGALITSALFATGAANAGVMIDLDGPGGAAPVSIDAFDWSQSTLLAKDANIGAVGFGTTCGNAPLSPCLFDVLTHAKLGTVTPTGGEPGTALADLGIVGEITMVTRIGMILTNDIPGKIEFVTRGDAWLEIYYDNAADSKGLTGAGFNDGTLIARFTGAIGDDLLNPAVGSFTVTGGPAVLDQVPPDNYPGQTTLTGNGSLGNVVFGTDSVSLAPGFFLGSLSGITMNFSNISTSLPFLQANPSDCFNPNQRGAVGTVYAAGVCADVHVSGPYSAQGDDGGYAPRTGDVNIQDNSNPDFVAQSDFNSALIQQTPEPTSIALLGV